jgi:hypothetical protein
MGEDAWPVFCALVPVTLTFDNSKGTGVWMELTTVVAVVAVIAFGGLQYLLMINALRDLLARSRVRGDNKVAWALVILCAPIVGALVYSWMGPMSFRSRPATRPGASVVPPPVRNVTPITHAPSMRTRQTRPVVDPAQRARRGGSRSA